MTVVQTNYVFVNLESPSYFVFNGLHNLVEPIYCWAKKVLKITGDFTQTESLTENSNF